MFLASLFLIASQVAVAATPTPVERPDPMLLGPKIGQPFPPFEATDQNGKAQTFASLKGPNGLVLVFFRSADW